MDRSCEICGDTFTAKRAAARYCSARCRKRAQRNPGTTQSPPAVPVVPLLQPDSPPEDVGDLAAGVAEATRRALMDLGRLESPLGQATMVLARRLDNPGSDTGAGLASLAKQYQATFAVATEGAKVEEDPLDELRARRDRKKQAL